jgi:hypothetical protein
MRSYSFAWILKHRALKVHNTTIPIVASLTRFPPELIANVPHTWIPNVNIRSFPIWDVYTTTLAPLGARSPRSFHPLGSLCFRRFSRENRPPRPIIIVTHTHPRRRWIYNPIVSARRFRIRFVRCRTPAPARRSRVRFVRCRTPGRPIRRLHRSWIKFIWWRRAFRPVEVAEGNKKFWWAREYWCANETRK